MKTLLLFDSYFGNTEKIARAIASAFENESDFTILRNKDAIAKDLSNYDLLIVGSPTRGFRPTDDVSQLIKAIKSKALQGKKVAAFDTRVMLENIHSKILKTMVNTGGYAAKPIAKRLKGKGAEIIIDPEGFYVMDTEGPLKEGELERAKEWGNSIRNILA